MDLVDTVSLFTIGQVVPTPPVIGIFVDEADHTGPHSGGAAIIAQRMAYRDGSSVSHYDREKRRACALLPLALLTSRLLDPCCPVTGAAIRSHASELTTIELVRLEFDAGLSATRGES